MIKHIAIFLLLISNAIAGAPDEKLHQQCIYPTVMILKDIGVKQGSGVIVSSRPVKNIYVNTVFTVSHAVRDCKVLTLYVSEYKNWSTRTHCTPYEAKIVRDDSSRDIAVLTFISDAKMPTATIDWKPKLYIGNELLKVACGQCLSPRVDYGVLTSLSVNIDNKYVHRTNVFTVPGDSGGGIYHEYQLVGITNCIQNINDSVCYNISYYTPVKGNFYPEDFR